MVAKLVACLDIGLVFACMDAFWSSGVYTVMSDQSGRPLRCIGQKWKRKHFLSLSMFSTDQSYHLSKLNTFRNIPQENSQKNKFCNKLLMLRTLCRDVFYQLISLSRRALCHILDIFSDIAWMSPQVHIYITFLRRARCVCGSFYSMLHNVVSSILWFFQSIILTEQSRFTLYIFFAQVIHITWIISSCAHFNFSHCIWIAYTSDPFWTRISTQSSTYFECTTLVRSRMEHFSRYFSITFVMEFRHTSLA